MILTDINKIKHIINSHKKINKPIRPFDDLVINFLNDFQKKISKTNINNRYTDISALVFWLRKQHLFKIKKNYEDGNIRIGLGIAFHITPSNMPLNFFYSYILGLLSGNVNFVKIPNKNFDQIKIIDTILTELFCKKKYNTIKKMSIFIRYSRNNKIISEISNICNVRIIWGGDSAITEIRKNILLPKSREITFSDRYSCSLINANKLSKLKENDFKNLCRSFFSDGYLIDQNACTSPHLILWLGKNQKIKKKFWNEVYKIVLKNYDLPEIGSLDKYTLFCSDLINNKIRKNNKINSYLYVNQLISLPKDITSLRGKWGYFYEYKLKNLDEIVQIINEKFQTVSCFGFDNKRIVNLLVNNNSLGVDRVVPIGQAHVMNLKWDGYDMINSLSRIINYE